MAEHGIILFNHNVEFLVITCVFLKQRDNIMDFLRSYLASRYSVVCR